jgi:excisionase family DNA binding protein
MSKESQIDSISFSPRDAARFLGCSEYTIKELARRKLIPSYRVGNRIRFSRNGLEQWAMMQEEKSWNHL